MKKILSLVLVIAMMASLVVFAPAASAANLFTIEVTDATASAGDTVTLDVKLTGTTVFMFGLALEYDSTRLANPVIDADEDGLFAKGYPIAGAEYQLSYTSNASDAVNGVDVSEPTTMFRITFDVLGTAEAGDAYVRCAPFKGDSKIYIGETDTKATGAKYDWDVVEGTVTILPEGYKAAATTPADELWDFDDSTGTIYAYLGEELSGDIAIPSQIGGVDVVEIYADGASVIDGFDVTSILVPETVEYISAGAFLNLAACTDIYVLNPDCEIEDTAMGYDGSWRRSKLTVTGQSLDADDNTLLTLHGFAGSTAETYATTGDGEYPFGWVEYEAPATITIDVDGDTTEYVAGAAVIAAPGASVVNGKTVVAWNVNGETVLPGTEVAVDGDITFEAITADIATVNGASMKIVNTAADTALRFTASINMADYAAIEEAFGADKVSHGMLIVPQQYVAKAGGFTHEALETYGKGYLDFAMTGCYEIAGDDYILAASIKGFTASTLAKNPRFNAVAYIAIEVGGDTSYVYSTYSTATARDAKSVITNALTTATGDAKTWLTDLLGDFS